MRLHTRHTNQIVYDMPDRAYRRAPAVSYSGLKTILDCPARYQWNKHNRVEKRVFDTGHMIHGMVLGVANPYTVLDFPDRRTKAYKDAETEAREAGLIPVLAKDYAPQKAAAEAVLAHPIAGAIFESGHPEVSLFWDDSETGEPCKGRVDWLTTDDYGCQTIVDFKTVGRIANPKSFARDAATLDYHMQNALYTDGVETITGEPPIFLNVVVEVDAPHLVSVVQLDAEAVAVGRDRYRDAITTYQGCRTTGHWPGYTEGGIALISLPAWALNTHHKGDNEDE